ncbi:MAG: GGDEF domain-containing protein [Pseudobdellovibrio sp.]
MKIRDYSTQFSISIFSQNVDIGSRLKYQVSQAGYQSFFFADLDLLLNQVNTDPSHIVIFDSETSLLPLHQFVEKALKASAEIRFIILAQHQKIPQLSGYKEFNTDFVLPNSDPMLEYLVLWSVDSICENILRTYQNEQLLVDLNEAENTKIQIESTLSHERSSSQVRPYQTRIAAYKTATSKENILDLFYQQTPNQSWIYLKFVPTIQTFLCVSYHQVPEDWIEGISFKIPAKDKEFINTLLLGQLPHSLETYLLNKFNVARLKFLPMIVGEKIEGILVSTQDIAAEVAEDFSLMSLIYELNFSEIKNVQTEVEDNFTGFYNKSYYFKILERELDQAKRVLQPLSVIKIGIDKLAEIEISQGRRAADEVLREVADQLKFSSRISDYICRTDENEFALILVNCSKKGAAIRAERVRLGVNQARIQRNGLDITVSQGIAEYPMLTHDVVSLDDLATRALKFISSKGGDKICIAKAHKDHTPDFTVDG